MKLTKRQLKQLIKEELGEVLAGGSPPRKPRSYRQSHAVEKPGLRPDKGTS
jgi:hypothetical protein